MILQWYDDIIFSVHEISVYSQPCLVAAEREAGLGGSGVEHKAGLISTTSEGVTERGGDIIINSNKIHQLYYSSGTRGEE